jgi:hypothetical protein
MGKERRIGKIKNQSAKIKTKFKAVNKKNFSFKFDL